MIMADYARLIVPVVQLLVRHGADVNASGDDENTPLHLACQQAYPNVALVEQLLSLGAEPDVCNHCGNTPLFGASSADSPYASETEKKLAVMVLLLEAGANPCARNMFGRTPLHDAIPFEACTPVAFNLAELLLLHGALLLYIN